MPRLHPRVLGIVAAALLLTGCAGANAATPNWVPQPTFTGDGGQAATPAAPGDPSEPSASPSSGQSAGPGSGSSRGPSASGAPATPAQDPNVVATKLTTPTGIAPLPDGTALVGERTTGRILIVPAHPATPLQPARVIRTLPGLSFAGDGGLLDLAISPTYAQDQLIYAYITTPTDNRVVHFTLTGPATVVLSGIPKGATDNAGRIMFDSVGNLYIGTGDAGQPALATTVTSLAGKILRVDDIGRPAAGNVQADSPVYASGFRTVDGLCEDSKGGPLFQDQAKSASTADQINVITPGSTYDTQASPGGSAGATLPAAKTGVGSCAVIGSKFYITSRDGESLLTAAITTTATTTRLGNFSLALGNAYGRLLTVVASPLDNSLWLTTTNKDGHGQPIAADERVLHIPAPVPGGPSGTSPL